MKRRVLIFTQRVGIQRQRVGIQRQRVDIQRQRVDIQRQRVDIQSGECGVCVAIRHLIGAVIGIGAARSVHATCEVHYSTRTNQNYRWTRVY